MRHWRRSGDELVPVGDPRLDNARPARSFDDDAITVDRSGLPNGIEVLEDGAGLALRVYEPAGRRGTVELDVPEGWTVEAESNLLEEPEGEAEMSFSPFQVRSWILRS